MGSLNRANVNNCRGGGCSVNLLKNLQPFLDASATQLGDRTDLAELGAGNPKTVLINKQRKIFSLLVN